jgi:hypothetical protein
MTQYPVVLDVTASGNKIRVRATTSIERAFEGSESLQAELRCIEIDYQATLAAVKASLASVGSGKARDPRVYWFAGKWLAEFIERAEGHGFYVVGKNKTPAKHLGMSASSVGKMMAFYHRYPDPFRIDISVSWAIYRDNKESRK